MELRFTDHSRFGLKVIVHLFVLAIFEDASQKADSGNLRYSLYASLHQRPSICIVESGMPAAAAADAPPIRNECVLMFTSGIIDCMISDQRRLVKNVPFAYVKNGPVPVGW